MYFYEKHCKLNLVNKKTNVYTLTNIRFKYYYLMNLKYRYRCLKRFSLEEIQLVRLKIGNLINLCMRKPDITESNTKRYVGQNMTFDEHYALSGSSS